MATAQKEKQDLQKKVKVVLLKTVQVEPGQPALLPGEQELPSDVADDLKKSGLAE